MASIAASRTAVLPSPMVICTTRGRRLRNGTTSPGPAGASARLRRRGLSLTGSGTARLPAQALEGGQGGAQPFLLRFAERGMVDRLHRPGYLRPHAREGPRRGEVEPGLELDLLLEKRL